ncbi:MAG: shikimate kinase [Catalinimonas sp.]
MRHVYLVGLPGSGKSTLGRALAAALERPFVDLDDVIEARAGRAIRDIFATEGEAHFRTLERAALAATAARTEPLVVATGGGTPCFLDNGALLKNTGTSVFLDVPVATIVARLEADDPTVRPLLHNQKIKYRLEQLSADRRAYYLEADVHLSGNNLAAEAVLAQLSC